MDNESILLLVLYKCFQYFSLHYVRPLNSSDLASASGPRVLVLARAGRIDHSHARTSIHPSPRPALGNYMVLGPKAKNLGGHYIMKPTRGQA